MDFNEQIELHIRWKSTTEWLLFQETDAATIDQLAQADGCKLGQWLSSQQATSAEQAQWLESLIEVHDTFHKKLQEIMLFWNQGQIEKARQTHFEFEMLSEKIVSLLRQSDSQ